MPLTNATLGAATLLAVRKSLIVRDRCGAVLALLPAEDQGRRES